MFELAEDGEIRIGSGWKGDPHRRLWCAVLVVAIQDALGRGGKSDPERYYERCRIRDEALAWFERNGKSIGSFQWVCDILGLDAGEIRRKLKMAVGGKDLGDEMAKLIVGYRRRHKLSREEFAEKVGCSGYAVGCLERGFIGGYRSLGLALRIRRMIREER